MQVQVNGELREYEEPQSVHSIVTGLGLDPRKIAVERNLEIVPRSAYDRTAVGAGDRLEIVHFIGGGAVTRRRRPRTTTAGRSRAGASARG